LIHAERLPDNLVTVINRLVVGETKWDGETNSYGGRFETNPAPLSTRVPLSTRPFRITLAGFS